MPSRRRSIRPNTPMRKLSISVPAQTLEWLEALAVKERRSRSAQIDVMILQGLEEHPDITDPKGYRPARRGGES